MQGVTLRRAGRRIWRKRQLYFLLLPALVSVAIFHYIPIYGVQIAFKDFKSSGAYGAAHGLAWSTLCGSSLT